MKKMTSVERVLAAARHEPVDRIPLMLWIESHATLKLAEKVVRPKRLPDRIFFDSLSAIQNIMPTEELKNFIPHLGYLATADYFIQLGSDMIEFPWFNPVSFLKKFRIHDGKPIVTDVYGAERSMMGLYMEIHKVPCSKPEDLDSYVFPELNNKQLYNGIRMFKILHPGIAVAADVPGIQDVSQWFSTVISLF